MPEFLGFDTSNYTTSVAVFNSTDGSIRQSKRLLPVKEGHSGLRQSDALFHHINQLTGVSEKILKDLSDVKAVGFQHFREIFPVLICHVFLQVKLLLK